MMKVLAAFAALCLAVAIAKPALKKRQDDDLDDDYMEFCLAITPVELLDAVRNIDMENPNFTELVDTINSYRKRELEKKKKKKALNLLESLLEGLENSKNARVKRALKKRQDDLDWSDDDIAEWYGQMIWGCILNGIAHRAELAICPPPPKLSWKTLKDIPDDAEVGDFFDGVSAFLDQFKKSKPCGIMYVKEAIEQYEKQEDQPDKDSDKGENDIKK